MKRPTQPIQVVIGILVVTAVALLVTAVSLLVTPLVLSMNATCEVSQPFHSGDYTGARHLSQSCNELELYTWAEDNCLRGYIVITDRIIGCQPKQP